MITPRVSVIVPVFNGEACIARALDSVLAQGFRDAEVIVVEDGSTDGTPAVLRRYDRRIKVLPCDRHCSGAARNLGVLASSAEYIAFLDADDVWLPGMLAATTAALDSAREAVMVYCDAIPVDENDQPVGDSYVPPDKARAPSMDDLLQDWWPILPSTMLVRREVYRSCGGFPESFSGSRGFAAGYFLLLAREQGPFLYLHERLARYRILPFVDRMEKYTLGFPVYSHLVRARYGEAGERGLRRRGDFYSWLLTERASQALARGETRQARQALRCARRYKPLSRRNKLRLLRSYLPAPLALALTSRRRQTIGAPAGIADHLNSY